MLAAFGKIGDNPERCAAEDGKYRSFILDRHSYHIVYRIEARKSVCVVAIAHTSRQPGFWKGR
jgi:plasmid stabilization system protein ParE